MSKKKKYSLMSEEQLKKLLELYRSRLKKIRSSIFLEKRYEIYNPLNSSLQTTKEGLQNAIINISKVLNKNAKIL